MKNRLLEQRTTLIVQRAAIKEQLENLEKILEHIAFTLKVLESDAPVDPTTKAD